MPLYTDAMTAQDSTTRALRSKDGCRQCRKRKRKCDEQQPSCSACLERALSCEYQRADPVRRRYNRRQQLFNKDFAIPQEMGSLTTVFAVPAALVMDELLLHFRNNSPLWLTTCGDAKSFACVDLISPIVHKSPLVMNCVLTLAAGDLCKYRPMKSDMTSLYLSFYGQAVAGLHVALDQELQQIASEHGQSSENGTSQTGCHF